jgi:hypothetical protein
MSAAQAAEAIFKLLTKWKDTETTVRLSVNGIPRSKNGPRPFHAEMDGVILVAEEADKIVVVKGDRCSCQMSFDECVFHNSRLLNADETDSAEIEAIIRIDFPNGEVCVLTAIRALN